MYRLLNTYRGWDTEHTPVQDVRWAPQDTSAVRVADRRILFVHGLRDRIARPDLARRLAGVLGRRNDVGFIGISNGTHAMLRHRRTFDRCTGDFVRNTLLGEPVEGPVAEVFLRRAVLQLDP